MRDVCARGLKDPSLTRFSFQLSGDVKVNKRVAPGRYLFYSIPCVIFLITANSKLRGTDCQHVAWTQCVRSHRFDREWQLSIESNTYWGVSSLLFGVTATWDASTFFILERPRVTLLGKCVCDKRKLWQVVLIGLCAIQWTTRIRVDEKWYWDWHSTRVACDEDDLVHTTCISIWTVYSYSTHAPIFSHRKHASYNKHKCHIGVFTFFCLCLSRFKCWAFSTTHSLLPPSTGNFGTNAPWRKTRGSPALTILLVWLKKSIC